MTTMQIMAKLWSHITDLRLYVRGKSSKTLAEIRKRHSDNRMLLQCIYGTGGMS